jgi:murein DD-endopeptidase MepM/ murein hydrolase activator NlpD
VNTLRQYHFEKFMKTCALFVALILAVPVFPQSKIDFLQEGRDYTNLFYDGKARDIWLNLSPPMKKVFTEADAILGMRWEINEQNGAETAVIEEHVLLQGEFILYQRIVMFQKVTTPMMVQWSFDNAGVVVGFFIRVTAAGESQFLDYKDKTALRLPFKGTWLVLAGGRSVAQNHHAISVDQRFAADITAIRHGRIFSGDGTRLEQYFCFGRNILAPATGTVVEVHDGTPDNPINAPFASPPAGNFVMIDFGNSEYSLLAHFKLGSIKVKAGDKVQPGQTIGKCGNSGNTSVPHLHIHLQDTPVLFEGKGLPMEFQNYLADKKFVNTGEPVSGQILRDKQPK